MTAPLIVAVDDDPDLMTVSERQLRTRYEPDHRVRCLGSTAEALTAWRS
jgi:thioredoxin reductase (NADPH)